MKTQPIRQYARDTLRAQCRADAVIRHAESLLAAMDRQGDYDARIATDERLLARMRCSDRAHRNDVSRLLAEIDRAAPADADNDLSPHSFQQVAKHNPTTRDSDVQVPAVSLQRGAA